MTPEESNPAARYVTLRDYLRVVRRYWLLIVVIALAGAAAGLADALRQTATYEAASEISFQDPAQDLGVVGLGSSSVQTPGQVAAVNAGNVTAPDVMRAAA